MLAGLALFGMCVGGTALSELLDENTKESHKKSAKAIAEVSVMLGDSILEVIDETPKESK